MESKTDLTKYSVEDIIKAGNTYSALKDINDEEFLARQMKVDVLFAELAKKLTHIYVLPIPSEDVVSGPALRAILSYCERQFENVCSCDLREAEKKLSSIQHYFNSNGMPE